MPVFRVASEREVESRVHATRGKSLSQFVGRDGKIGILLDRWELAKSGQSRARGKRGTCIDPAGYDAGKKIMGRKRHILVDTQGLLMHAIVHAADIQDRDGGAALMALVSAFPFLTKLFADGGYRGSQFQAAIGRTLARVTVEIVKRSDQAKAFVVLPKRWIVERTLAWLGRCRKLAKDWECLNRKALAFLRLASIRLMLRKLCNPT